MSKSSKNVPKGSKIPQVEKDNQSFARLWLFRIILVLLPFAILALSELGLRAVGYGQSIPLFMNNPQAPEYRLPTPNVVSRYFTDPKAGPNVTIETNFFLADKPENGLRIFVQGGSTAAGFPYGYGASIAGMLDYRLKQTYPDREVEVVNTALSAVNSYTLLDFADEIIAEQPDAILIYAGHNEYLGIMGVGSTYSKYSSRGANLLFLKLKDLRLFQLMQNVYGALFSSSSSSSDEGSERGSLALSSDSAISNQHERQSRTVMSKVAKHKKIDVSDTLFQAGLKQFEGNMRLLLAKYKAAGIPVFISTIGSNLADQAPFESHDIDAKYDYLLEKPATKLEGIEPSILGLQAQKHKSAKAYFALGQYYLSKKLTKQALQNFQLAKQHDLLRFRAPQEMNQIIRQLASPKEVVLVDANEALFAASINGVVGESMMLEHLHPTVNGYFEIANAFYEKLMDAGTHNNGTNDGDFPAPKKVVKRFNAVQDLPLFESEIYKGHATIASLKSDYPFTSTPTKPMLPAINNQRDKLGFAYYKKQASWLQIAQFELTQANKSGDKQMAMRAAKLLSDAVPNNTDYAFQAGTTLIAGKQADQAFRYLLRVLRHKPNDINAQLALAHASIETKNYRQAEQWLLKVQAIEPDHPVVKQNLSNLQSFIRKSP